VTALSSRVVVVVVVVVLVLVLVVVVVVVLVVVVLVVVVLEEVLVVVVLVNEVVVPVTVVVVPVTVVVVPVTVVVVPVTVVVTVVVALLARPALRRRTVEFFPLGEEFFLEVSVHLIEADIFLSIGVFWSASVCVTTIPNVFIQSPSVITSHLDLVVNENEPLIL